MVREIQKRCNVIEEQRVILTQVIEDIIVYGESGFKLGLKKQTDLIIWVLVWEGVIRVEECEQKLRRGGCASEISVSSKELRCRMNGEEKEGGGRSLYKIRITPGRPKCWVVEEFE